MYGEGVEQGKATESDKLRVKGAVTVVTSFQSCLGEVIQGWGEGMEKHLSSRGRREQCAISEKGCSTGLDMCFALKKVSMWSNMFPGLNKSLS